MGTINPVALIWLGACASIPLLVCSVLTPMASARGRMAKSYVTVIYGPLVFLQFAFGYILYHVRFIDLPKLYLAGFGLLLSVPCFIIWCFCLVCASRYGRQDLALVEYQRIERGRQAAQNAKWRITQGTDGELTPNQGLGADGSIANLVDCTE